MRPLVAVASPPTGLTVGARARVPALLTGARTCPALGATALPRGVIVVAALGVVALAGVGPTPSAPAALGIGTFASGLTAAPGAGEMAPAAGSGGAPRAGVASLPT